MRRILLVGLLLTFSASESWATNKSILNRILPKDQFVAERYAGYYRVMKSAEPGSATFFVSPSQTSQKIGELNDDSIVASDGVTLQGADTTWLKVVIDERVGWVQIRNLRHISPKTFPGTELAISGHCSGYDPLWALSWNAENVRLSTYPGAEMLSIGMDTFRTSLNVTSFRNATSFAAANQAKTAEVVFDGIACAPTAVEGLIGSSVSVVLIGGAERRFLIGCCQPTAAAFGN